MRTITPLAALSLLISIPQLSQAGAHQLPGAHHSALTLPAGLPGPKVLPVFNTANKGTTVQSRLIAQYNGQGNISGVYENMDSTIYKYPNPNTSFYNTDLGFQWNGASYDSSNKDVYVYDGSGRILSMTGQQFNGTTWDDYYRYVYAYDAAGNDTSLKIDIYMGGSWMSVFRIHQTYNASNSNTSTVAEQFDGATNSWIGYFRDTSIYNSSNLITTYEYDSWDMNTSAYAPVQRDLTYYNTSNFAIAVAHQNPNGIGTGWSTGDSSYNSSLNAAGMPLVTIDYVFTGAGWDNNYRTTYTYSATNNVTSILNETWNGSAFVNQQREFDTYNSFDQSTGYYTQTWDGTAWTITTNDYVSRLYYQTYNPAGVSHTGITSISDIRLFPNPSVNAAQLQISWKEATPFTVSVSDATGKIYQQWSENGSLQYSHQLSTASLPSGIYYIKLTGNNEATTRMLQVQH